MEKGGRENRSFWELYIEDISLPIKAKIHQLKGQQAGEAPPEPGTSVEPHKGLSQVFLDPPRILPGVSRVEKTSECSPDVPSRSSGEGVVPDLSADRKCFYPKTGDLKKSFAALRAASSATDYLPFPSPPPRFRPSSKRPFFPVPQPHPHGDLQMKKGWRWSRAGGCSAVRAPLYHTPT